MNNFIDEFFSMTEEIFSVMGIAWGIGGILGFALFILGGFAIYKMSQQIGLKHSWISFIPFVQCFCLGRIAERYIKKDGTKSTKFSLILLIFNILQFIFAIVFFVLLIISILSIIVNIEDAVVNDIEITLSMFSSFIPVIVFYFVLIAFAIIYKVFYYIALWRVFAIFDNSNATVYLILSIFSSVLSPIFLFVIRNNNAAFDYKSRLGYFELEQV